MHTDLLACRSSRCARSRRLFCLSSSKCAPHLLLDRYLPMMLALTTLQTTACGPGAVAETVRPKDPSAGEALGEAQCRSVERGGEPLIVDWKPEQRGDLEVAMQDGVAVFSYSCQKMELLGDCRLEGSYGFIGMTKREQMLRLQNADEVRVNLPLTGASLAAELQRDSSIDIAMVMVGKKRTTWTEPTQADLKGQCAGATHYVRAATVGAFVLELGSAAKVRAAADLLGASAASGSRSSREVKNKDGEPSDCTKSTPSDKEPPAQCGAPIRLLLAPVGQQATQPAETPAAPGPMVAPALEDLPSCPEGFVLAEGKCMAAGRSASHLCDPADETDCKTQCDNGHAGSCGALGALLARSDAAKARGYLSKGCDGGVAEACVVLGRLVEQGSGAKRDLGAATELYEKACSAGVASGCGRLGHLYLSGSGVSANTARAAQFLIRGCDGGDDTACAEAAPLLAEGKGVTVDRARAAKFQQRACAGSVVESCLQIAKQLESGAHGTPKNAMLAESAFRRACFRGSAEGCVELGRFEYARNPSGAKHYFDQGCMRRVPFGCAALVVAFSEQRPFFPDVAQQNALSNSCNGGNNSDCTRLGVLQIAAKNPIGKATLNRACITGDRFACEMQKRHK